MHFSVVFCNFLAGHAPMEVAASVQEKIVQPKNSEGKKAQRFLHLRHITGQTVAHLGAAQADPLHNSSHQCFLFHVTWAFATFPNVLVCFRFPPCAVLFEFGLFPPNPATNFGKDDVSTKPTHNLQQNSWQKHCHGSVCLFACGVIFHKDFPAASASQGFRAST